MRCSVKCKNVPQRENHALLPAQPYGVAKVYAHWITVNYRDAYNLFAWRKRILFNHDRRR